MAPGAAATRQRERIPDADVRAAGTTAENGSGRTGPRTRPPTPTLAGSPARPGNAGPAAGKAGGAMWGRRRPAICTRTAQPWGATVSTKGPGYAANHTDTGGIASTTGGPWNGHGTGEEIDGRPSTSHRRRRRSSTRTTRPRGVTVATKGPGYAANRTNSGGSTSTTGGARNGRKTGGEIDGRRRHGGGADTLRPQDATKASRGENGRPTPPTDLSSKGRGITSPGGCTDGGETPIAPAWNYLGGV